MHIYNNDFWYDFVNYVKLCAWRDYRIEWWDTYKQEVYFHLNKDRIIKDYFSYKCLNFSDNWLENLLDESEETKVLEEIKNLRKWLRQEIDKILIESYRDVYPDLFEDKQKD